MSQMPAWLHYCLKLPPPVFAIDNCEYYQIGSISTSFWRYPLKSVRRKALGWISYFTPSSSSVPPNVFSIDNCETVIILRNCQTLYLTIILFRIFVWEFWLKRRKCLTVRKHTFAPWKLEAYAGGLSKESKTFGLCNWKNGTNIFMRLFAYENAFHNSSCHLNCPFEGHDIFCQLEAEKHWG